MSSGCVFVVGHGLAWRVALHVLEHFLPQEPELLSPSERPKLPSVDLVPHVADRRVHHLRHVSRGHHERILGPEAFEDLIYQISSHYGPTLVSAVTADHGAV